MTIRKFRQLTRAQRREVIQTMDDPLTRRILELAFLGPGKRSWVWVAFCIGGNNDPESVRKRAQRALKPVPFSPGKRGKMKVQSHQQS